MLCVPFLERSLHSSAMDQRTLKTRTTPTAANHEPSPPAEVFGKLWTTTRMQRALRASRSCKKRWSHSCALSTLGLSHKPGAQPFLGLVFILG
ncbi:hCG1774694 [Homo sapiens]|uniref:HCG1774694 n=1 Tax=Homo sapiens TaxID=9606 RepID=B6EBE3_HUMAN|nr:hepatoma associated protein [Homo sapiens]ACI46635.1 hepatoma associated protein [Homo sapiens]EAW59167.1 hCG1774694 [Homo sapiens]